MLLCERETRRALVCSKADIEDHPVFFLFFLKLKAFHVNMIYVSSKPSVCAEGIIRFITTLSQ